MTKFVEGLVTHVQNQDAKIAKLMDKIKKVNENSPFVPKQPKTHDDVETSFKIKDTSKSHVTMNISISPDGAMHVNHLEEFI